MGSKNQLHTKRVIICLGKHKENETINDYEHSLLNGNWKGRFERTYYEIYDAELLEGLNEQLSSKRAGVE